MSEQSAEHIKGEIRRYWIVGFALFLLTIVTVTVSYLDFSTPVAVLVALVIAAVKGGLVAAVFMHLISERQAIYALLLVTLIFFVAVLVGPLGARLGSIAGG